MSLQTVIVLNAILDLGIVRALAATVLIPFTLDPRKDEATVHTFAAPLPADLAA